MEENSQIKIQRLKQRVKDYLFVAEQDDEYKRIFIANSLYDKSKEDEMNVIIVCVKELSIADLNSICSYESVIGEFRELVEINKSFLAEARQL